MKYDKPIMEILLFHGQDVIRTSLNNGDSGDGDGYDGDWSN